MRVFDKAQWHIDAGENAAEVIAKFQNVFSFLDNHNMLSDDGCEILEFGIDSSISLNEQMLSKSGYDYLDKFYDKVINCKSENIMDELEKRFELG